MGPDGRAGVAEAAGRWVAYVPASLPRHSVGRPDHEIVAALFGRLVLEAGSRGLRPSTEQQNV